MEIIYFISHPIQYFTPLFQKLSKVVSLKVYYYSDASIKGAFDKGFGKNIKWDIPLLEGYNHEFVPSAINAAAPNNKLFDLFNPGVYNIIRKYQGEVILINGWSYLSDWLVLLSAKIFGKKVWIRAENPINQEIGVSKVKLLLKKILLKHILFKYFIDKALFIGTQNKYFFLKYGFTEEQLVFTPYAVNNEYFDKIYETEKDSIERYKSEIEVSGKKVVLFCGKYIAKKRPMDIVRAFHLANRQDAILILVGEGELRVEIEAYINKNLINNIILTGFINQTRIPFYYLISDVFVMSSGVGETWGLAVNEAMNFAKPVIVSKTCGCSIDLVKPGVNGFVYEEGDIPALQKYLEYALDNDDERIKMGAESKRMISDFSYDTTVNNISTSLGSLKSNN